MLAEKAIDDREAQAKKKCWKYSKKKIIYSRLWKKSEERNRMIKNWRTHAHFTQQNPRKGGDRWRGGRGWKKNSIFDIVFFHSIELIHISSISRVIETSSRSSIAKAHTENSSLVALLNGTKEEEKEEKTERCCGMVWNCVWMKYWTNPGNWTAEKKICVKWSFHFTTACRGHKTGPNCMQHTNRCHCLVKAHFSRLLN